MTGAANRPVTGFAERRAALVARPDLRGAAFTRALAAAADEWLRGIFAAAAGPAPSDLALVAVGGYGRGEVAPGSDIDLVLVHRNRSDIRQVADAVWYPIWNDRVLLDHSVRNLREMGAAMDADLKVALGLLDVRTVAGSTRLGAEVRQAALDKWAARARRWLPEVGGSVLARHDTAGDLAFLLEPDLKEARGGLRDLNLLNALAQVTPVVAGLVADGRLDGPGATLTAARVELHRLTGRSGDRLQLQDQDAVAAALGVDADVLAARLAVAGRAVAWASDEAWRRIDGLQPRSRLRRRGNIVDLEPGLVLRAGEVDLAYGADPGADPTLALRAAALSAERDLPMAKALIDRLVDSAPAPAGGWPDELLQALLRLLDAGRPAVAAVETLDQQGVVERLLPEWKAVRNRPQRNAYHRFTVDRHLLETVAYASELVRRVARPDLLLLAALFHDIGKGYPGDHTDAGLTVISDVGPRLGLPEPDVATLATLVRCHLLLSEVATRRDLDDPATVAGVAAAVGDRGTLELLAALTEADSLATGPAAWGPWKAGLVARLVGLVARSLAGLPPPEPPPPTAEERRLLDLVAGGDGRVLDASGGEHLVVVAQERPGLLAAVAGVLALSGASVRRASFAHPGAGATILRLDVTPTWDVLPDPARVQADLAAALDGRLSVEAELGRRDRVEHGAGPWADPWRRRQADKRAVHPDEPRVSVLIDNAASTDATLLEVRAPDGRGTLWRIAHAIDRAGLRVRSALANTLGADVVDTFYVQTAAGTKVASDEETTRRLRAVLVEAADPA